MRKNLTFYESKFLTARYLRRILPSADEEGPHAGFQIVDPPVRRGADWGEPRGIRWVPGDLVRGAKASLGVARDFGLSELGAELRIVVPGGEGDEAPASALERGATPALRGPRGAKGIGDPRALSVRLGSRAASPLPRVLRTRAVSPREAVPGGPPGLLTLTPFLALMSKMTTELG